MTPIPLLTPAFHWIVGHHTPVRRHVMYCLGAAMIYGLTLLIMAHAAWLGIISHRLAWLLLACMVTTFVVFFTLVRSGWSQRFEDPVLTLPHAMVSLTIIVMAYVMVGDYRGDVIILLAQVLAVSMFRLRPREMMFLGCWATGLLTLAQIGLVWAGTPGFPPERALAQFIVCSISLLALSVVAMWISAMRVRISRQSDELRRTLVQAQALATTDVLTGLLNRRAMTDQLEDEMGRADRTAWPVCVALIDLDHFKRVNDQHGHRTGDEVLRTFAALAQGELRQVDRLARWGGEEFLLLMPHVEAPQAWVALERLRKCIAQHPMGEQAALTVTISAGVAQWLPGESLDQWLERADKALYQAKRSGRNRCLIADSVPVSAALPAGVAAEVPSRTEAHGAGPSMAQPSAT